MLPTDTTVLGDFLDANNHYANNVNQFELHTPDACRNYAAGMLLHTPGAHEEFTSSEIFRWIVYDQHQLIHHPHVGHTRFRRN